MNHLASRHWSKFLPDEVIANEYFVANGDKSIVVFVKPLDKNRIAVNLVNFTTSEEVASRPVKPEAVAWLVEQTLKAEGVDLSDCEIMKRDFA